MISFVIPQGLPGDELSKAIYQNIGRYVSFSADGFALRISDDLTHDEQVLVQQSIDSVSAQDWPFNKAKVAALTELDMVAEQVRSKYLTSAPLQAATYISKTRDALAYKTAGYPIPFVASSYPYVDSEMRAAGDSTAQAAADRILYEGNMYDAVKGSAIEYERRRGKIAVSNATTIDDIDSAKNLAVVRLQAL